MTEFRSFLRLCMSLCFVAASVAPVLASDAAMIDIPLSVRSVPADLWSKQRLEASIDADGRLRLKDTGSGPFNDASFWQIDFNQYLPYGRKEFSVRIDVGPQHRPLWGRNLLQPLLNGKEASAAVDETGKPSFEKIVADDGKGFVPVASATLRFTLPKAARTLGAFSFMTAGAENFDMTMSDFKVTAWPETDDRVWPQRPLMSELDYRPGEPKRLKIEWWDDADDLVGETVDILVAGPGGEQQLAVTVPRRLSTASGSRVSSVDLGAFDAPGSYQVTVPSTGPRTQDATIAFQVGDNAGQLARHRDDAWGVFYWITNTVDGPFPEVHPQDRAARTYGNETLIRDISGGWFDAGDYGKYTVNGAFSVGLMLLTGLLAPEVLDHAIEPLAGGMPDRPDWLDVAGAQLDWLVKMQGPDGGANHKATTRNWPALDIRPEDDHAVKWIMPVSSTATADYAAVMALAAKVLQRQDDPQAQEQAARFRAAAERARQWLARNPGLVMTQTRYDNSDYGGPYTDTDDGDERFFADAAWAALTRDLADIAAVEAQLEERRAALRAIDNDTHWGSVDLLGFWALKTIEDELTPEARETVDAALRSAAHQWRVARERSLWSIPHRDDAALPWGSNSVLATIGWHWLLWAQVSGDTRYLAPARDLAHWFFGRNPQGQTFVTGTSDRAAKDPHFRPYTSGAIVLPDGFLVGGPNSVNHSGDPAIAGLIGEPPMRIYVDHRDSYSTNEVAINWQAAWALYLSLLAAQGG